MADLKKNINLTVDEIKNYLKIENTTKDDNLIQKFLNSACDDGQNYMGRDFTDEEIPETVEVWILQHIALEYERRIGGLKSFRIGDENLNFSEELSNSKIHPYKIYPGT